MGLVRGHGSRHAACVVAGWALLALAATARAQDVVSSDGQPALRFSDGDWITFVTYTTLDGEPAFCLPVEYNVRRQGFLYVSRSRIAFKENASTVFDYARAEIREAKHVTSLSGVLFNQRPHWIQVQTPDKKYGFLTRFQKGGKIEARRGAKSVAEFFQRLVDEYDVVEQDFAQRSASLGTAAAPQRQEEEAAASPERGRVPTMRPATAASPPATAPAMTTAAVRLVSVEAEPPRLRAGQSVRLVAHLEVQGLPSASTVAVSEERHIHFGWDVIFSTPAPIVTNRGNGRHASVFEFTLPATSQPGVYEYTLSVRAPGAEESRKVLFAVTP